MRVWIALWTVYVVWGSTYLGIRFTVETIPPMLGAGARFLVAGLLFAAWAVVRRGVSSLRAGPAELSACAFVGVALLMGGNGLVSVAERAGTPSSLAALVIASVPLWIVLFRRLSGERPSRTTLLWVLTGFAGVALLLMPGERPEGATVGGVLIVVAAAFCWATGSFASGRLPLPADPVRSTTWQLLCGGAAMTLTGVAAGEASGFDVSEVSATSAAGWAYLVVFGSLVAFTAYTWVLQHAPISQVATYAYVNPVVAIALGTALAGEEITLLVGVAAAIIVGSVAGTIREEAPRAPSRPQELGVSARDEEPVVGEAQRGP